VNRSARVDETGFVMEVRLPLGTVAFVEERWAPSPAGLLWTVTMTAGFEKAPGQWLNGAIRKHRAEFLPQFVPELYAERARIFG
jgi:hypothetical protein